MSDGNRNASVRGSIVVGLAGLLMVVGTGLLGGYFLQVRDASAVGDDVSADTIDPAVAAAVRAQVDAVLGREVTLILGERQHVTTWGELGLIVDEDAVAREAARTLQYYRVGVHEIYDVGVAGLWRLLDRVEQLRDMSVVITVAGMEGTLPSVVAGLVPGLVIAVPVATGYGVAANGITALHSALASCAPGLVVVNVDNGYGAGCAALRMLNVMQRGSGLGDGSA